MKKVLALLLLLSILAGCSSPSAQAADIDVNAAADAIVEAVEFRDTLLKADGGAAENFYNLDDSIADYAIYISGSGATAEEVAVLKVADGSGRETAEKIVNTRVENLKFQFEDYVPAEMTKLGDPVIVSDGNTVILVLCDDTQAAKKVVDGLFK